MTRVYFIFLLNGPLWPYSLCNILSEEKDGLTNMLDLCHVYILHIFQFSLSQSYFSTSNLNSPETNYKASVGGGGGGRATKHT
jgi:hypothetical protein